MHLWKNARVECSSLKDIPKNTGLYPDMWFLTIMTRKVCPILSANNERARYFMDCIRDKVLY